MYVLYIHGDNSLALDILICSYKIFMSHNGMHFLYIALYEEVQLEPTILYDRDGCNPYDTITAHQELRHDVEYLLQEILEAHFDQD